MQQEPKLRLLSIPVRLSFKRAAAVEGGSEGEYEGIYFLDAALVLHTEPSQKHI